MTQFTLPWEGSGEYQRVSFDDGRNGYIRIPDGKRSLPTDWSMLFPPLTPYLSDDGKVCLRESGQ